MTDKKSIRRSQNRDEYVSRINRVIDYIGSNIDKELTLSRISEIANFSPYHFHRIFGAFVGETLTQYTNRIRVEKAAGLLVVHKKRSVTDIAFDCGFSSSAAFARSFKEFFGMSASEWKAGGHIEFRKKRKAVSKTMQEIDKKGKEFDISSYYIEADIFQQKWRINMTNTKMKIDVEVKELQDIPVAYIRHIGPYAGNTSLFEKLFNDLFKWAGPRNLLDFPETKVMAVYYDDPSVTDESKLRLDVCISVKPDTEVDGEIGKTTIKGGKYAIGHFELSPDEYPAAWKALYAGWLPESGYQPDDGPCFENYLNDPKEHPENKCVVDICIPVKPL